MRRAPGCHIPPSCKPTPGESLPTPPAFPQLVPLVHCLHVLHQLHGVVEKGVAIGASSIHLLTRLGGTDSQRGGPGIPTAHPDDLPVPKIIIAASVFLNFPSSSLAFAPTPVPHSLQTSRRAVRLPVTTPPPSITTMAATLTVSITTGSGGCAGCEAAGRVPGRVGRRAPFLTWDAWSSVLLG